MGKRPKTIGKKRTETGSSCSRSEPEPAQKGRKGAEKERNRQGYFFLSIAKNRRPEDSTPTAAGHRQQISQGRQPEPEARPEKRKKTGIFSRISSNTGIADRKTDRHRNPGRSLYVIIASAADQPRQQPPKTTPKRE